MNYVSYRGQHGFWAALIYASLSAGCAQDPAVRQPDAVAELRSASVVGYLPFQTLPDSRALVPPPPADGSEAFALDMDYSRRSVVLCDSPAWRLAVSDAYLMFPHAAGTFSCALNAPITEADTPHLYLLLRKTLIDAGLSTYAAKNYYRRGRPFASNKEPICTPAEQGRLEENGSYPSAHGAIGMTWALILAELSPGQTEEILARGRAFGLSRIVCNVHWYSDAIQGRNMASATVAKLHANPAFLADFKAAKAELDAVHRRGLKPQRACKSEAAAVAL
ncbi:acid phosphatase [Methylococcus geothermalis]|uniref:Acid phosphatase n=1 Tax=Methylococcus geothermalis TaxID=2681310 RepID=A0A858Q8W8_9GAMM|nr:phosphatase PAP2 family protein [Methylococcus geothermalis]QJD30277.1 phosphatase PAP2 family protein [Methylococcus geothermalis]